MSNRVWAVAEILAATFHAYQGTSAGAVTLDPSCRTVRGDIAPTVVAFSRSRAGHMFLRVSRDLQSNTYIRCYENMGLCG